MPFFRALTFVVTLFFSSNLFAQNQFNNTTAEYDCKVTNALIEAILEELAKGSKDVVKDLPLCYRLDRKLMLRISVEYPSQFIYAAGNLKSDRLFVNRLLKVDPSALEYADKKLRGDKRFMEQATYLSRDSLKYGTPELLDNKLFMKKMIDIDSRNYIFASKRLQKIPEFAIEAFKDDGNLLKYAPDEVKSDNKLVTIAVKSKFSALQYASKELQKNKYLKKLAKRKTSIKSFENLEEFLKENYLIKPDKKNLGFKIANQAKYFPDNKLIERNYITKWQKFLGLKGRKNDLRLISADSRNYPIVWQEDFKEYPELIKKVERFFLEHRIDRATIDKLSTTSLWKLKSHPKTLAFNIYLLRNSNDFDLGPDFSDITSLTAIVQKKGKKWNMTVIEVIFSSEVKVDVSYDNGHKKYILWDLYKLNEEDKSPKVIFKVEDRFREYFEIYEEQNSGKYQKIFNYEPSIEKNKN